MHVESRSHVETFMAAIRIDKFKYVSAIYQFKMRFEQIDSCASFE